MKIEKRIINKIIELTERRVIKWKKTKTGYSTSNDGINFGIESSYYECYFWVNDVHNSLHLSNLNKLVSIVEVLAHSKKDSNEHYEFYDSLFNNRLILGSIFEHATIAISTYEESLKYTIVSDNEGNHYKLPVSLVKQFKTDDKDHTYYRIDNFYDKYVKYAVQK